MKTQPPSLYLVGFRAAGKSFFSQKIAKKFSLPFHDLDSVFEEKYGKIEAFVATHGWAEFRKKESHILEKSHHLSGIIATGGGVIENKKNRAFLKNAATIFIDTPLEILLERLTKKTDNRPRLDKDISLEIEIKKNWQKRYPLYKEVCSAVLEVNIKDSTEKSIQQLSQLITSLIKTG